MRICALQNLQCKSNGTDPLGACLLPCNAPTVEHNAGRDKLWGKRFTEQNDLCASNCKTHLQPQPSPLNGKLKHCLNVYVYVEARRLPATFQKIEHFEVRTPECNNSPLLNGVSFWTKSLEETFFDTHWSNQSLVTNDCWLSGGITWMSTFLYIL